MLEKKDLANVFEAATLPGFLQIVEAAQEGIWLIDENDCTSFVNKKMCSILEYSAEEIMKQKVYDFMDEASRKNSLAQVERRKQGISEIHDSVFITKSGNRIWLNISTNPILDEDGKYKGALAMMTDITKRKKTEQEMAWLINNTEESFILLNHDLQIVSFNKQFKELYARYLGIHVAIGDSILNYAQPERRDAVKEVYRKVLEGIEEYDEIIIPLPNATQKNFAIKYKPAKDEHGKIIGAFVSVIDITEKKKAEKQQEFEQRDKEALINNTEDLIWSVSSDFKLIAANRAFIDSLKKMAGIHLYPGDELLIKKIFNPEFLEFWSGLYTKALQGESFTKQIYTAADEDGSEIWDEIKFNPIYDGNIITGIACYSRNITIEKKATAQQSLFESIVNSSDDAIISKTLDGVITSWNHGAEIIFGYTEKEALGNNISIIIPPDLINDEQGIISRMKAEKFIKQYETERLKKDGSHLYVSLTISPILDSNGNVVGASNITRDITQIKKAEEEIKESNKRFDYVTKATFDVIWDWDLMNQTIYWGESFQTIFGYDPKEIKKDISSWTEHIHSEDFDRVIKKVYESIYSDEIKWEDEYRFHKANQAYAYVVDKGFIIRDEQGKAIRMVGAMQDITGKKELGNLLDKANSLARIGNWEVDLIKGIVYFSDITKEIHEVEQDFIPDLQTAINFYKEGANRNLITQKVDGAIKNSISWDVELQIITANGNEKWIRSIGQPESVNGKCIKIAGSFQDIDARKKTELAVIEALEEKNIILESIGDAFFAVDKHWIVTYWNNQAEKMLNKPKNEIVGHHLWEVFSDSIDTISYKKYNQAIETKEVVQFEDYYPSLSKWYEISAYPSENGLSVYFKDVTERKLSEIHLNELNEDIQKHAKELAISNAELEQFAYVASHDLQEPLRMVTSYLTQLEKKYGDIIDEKGKKYIFFAVDGAKRMRQIILDLLEFSRAGKTEDSIENVDPNQLIGEIQILFRKQIEEKKAVIIVDELPQINAHRSPIRQVFQNLISNALKYCREDIPVQIHITADELKNHWQFAVSDNGIGIDKEYFDKIFIIFQRLHNKYEFSGTGMGLAVTKKIIENLGGKIWVESEEGKGSTFYFTLLKQPLT